MSDDDFEGLISSEGDENIQLVCPICRSKNFEKINLLGDRWYFVWRKARRPIVLLGLFSNLAGARPVTSYRCLHCDYIISFAHQE